jgi:hypothetical protein
MTCVGLDVEEVSDHHAREGLPIASRRRLVLCIHILEYYLEIHSSRIATNEEKRKDDDVLLESG